MTERVARVEESAVHGVSLTSGVHKQPSSAVTSCKRVKPSTAHLTPKTKRRDVAGDKGHGGVRYKELYDAHKV